MAVFVVCLLLLFTLTGISDAAFCACNTGLSDTVLQRNIDYACGNGADCSAIQQNGACFNPNTVRDHCNYAVNSYYQRRGQVTGSCDFQGTATVVQNSPSASSTCVYQSNPSTGGTVAPPAGGTPNTGGTVTPPAGGAPNTGGTVTPPAGGAPNTGGAVTPPAGGTPNTGGTLAPPTGTGFTPGATPTTNPGFGVGPTGSGFDNTGANEKLGCSSGRLMAVMVLATLVMM